MGACNVGLDRGVSWFATAVLNGNVDREIRRVGSRQWKCGDNLRIDYAQIAARAQLDILPDARVAIADPGDPIPPLGCDERRSVDGQIAAVLPRSCGDRLLVGDAGMRW